MDKFYLVPYELILSNYLGIMLKVLVFSLPKIKMRFMQLLLFLKRGS